MAVADRDAQRLVSGVGGHLGSVVREERRRLRWSARRLAEAAGVSRSLVQWVEAGHAASIETYARLASALRRRLEIELADPRSRSGRSEDPVHAAMGEAFAVSLKRFGFGLSFDEPYQHYQFAGRADVIAWDPDRAALLHVENRTRLPNFQDAMGAYNAKRQWLAPALADRLGLRRFRSVTHVFVCLWSADMLHAVRLRPASIAAVCPDGSGPLDAWLAGSPPADGVTSGFALFDPIGGGRSDRRRVIDLPTALRRATRPRYRGYADALEALRAAGQA